VENKADTLRVLVVDDEKDIREGSERILSRVGFQVMLAARGEEALERLSREGAEIVFLDLKMPGIDGMEVLGRIRALDESVLVIVITGYATVETAIEAMKKGAYDFIPKPFEPEQLRIVANRAAEKIRLVREAELLEQARRRTLIDLDTEKSRLHTILASLPSGVVVTNNSGQVVLMNPAFRQLLNLPKDTATGREIDAYIPNPKLCRLIKEISGGKHIDFDDLTDFEFALSDGSFLMARGQPVIGEKRECLGAVVTVVDISSLKMLDQLKSEFVAKVSHELRSPLSTIHEQLALVIQDMVGESLKQEQHILARAKEKTQGLISLIGDLLDLSRIEEGIICNAPQAVNLGDLLTNIVDFLATRAHGKNQSLTLELPDDDITPLTVDPLALESIFGNLITNAINYTPEGGSVKVRMDRAGINIRVQVIDNGFGIEARHLDHIFERFYRVKDDKTRYITGTGLGLPIVKGLVDSIGGMIEVESTYGQGSTFTVLLPASP
jgi:PAS domain S-box-containing protein